MRAFSPALPPARRPTLGSLLAQATVVWYPSQATGTNNNFIPNAVTGRTKYKGIVNRNFRTFELGVANGAGGGAGFLCGGGFGGTTIDPKFAIGMDGQQMASRLTISAGGSGGVRYRSGITAPAGTYWLSLDVQWVSGDNNVTMSVDGGSTSVTRVLSTTPGTWQRILYPFALGSSTSLDLRFLTPVNNSGVNVYLIDNAIMWDENQGPMPSSPWEHDGALFINNDSFQPTKIVSGQLVLGSENASSYLSGPITSDKVSYYAIAKRTGSYQVAGLGRYRFLHNPLDGSTGVIADADAEGNLQINWGGAFVAPYPASGANSLRPAGCSPDLLANGNFNVITFAGSKDQMIGKIGNAPFVQSYIPNGASNQTVTSLEIGKNVGMAHTLGPMALFIGKQHTQAEQESVRSSLVTTFGSAVPDWTNTLIACGDSITVGPGTANSYAALAMSNLAAKAGTTIYNIEAQAGSMINGNGVFQLNLSNRLGLNGLLGNIPSSLSGKRWVLTVLIGANDLDGFATPALWYAALLSLTNPIRAKGVKVGLCTILDKVSPWPNFATFNALAATANALIRNSAVANEADFVIDLAAVGGLTYVDGLHPDAAGHVALEPTYRAAILAQLL